MQRRRVLTALLLAMLLVVLAPLRARADGPIASGTWGTCDWSIDEAGLLLIVPSDGQSGQLADFGSGDYFAFPWTSKETFSRVRFADGVALPADCSYMFLNCTELVSVEAGSLDTSRVTTMKGMFKGCGSLYSVDVAHWDTSHVTDMSSMFWDCRSLGALALSGWNTSSVRFMDEMFLGCYGLDQLDLSRWDTSSLTSANKMFDSCSRLSSIDLTGWDTSHVAGMSNMFHGCTGLTAIDVSGFDMSQVTDMSYMFHYCTGLSSLDVSGWTTSQVTNMEGVFSDCGALTTLDVSGWDTARVTNMGSVFSGCSGLTSLDVSGWTTSQVTNMTSTFSGCSGLTSLDVSGWDTSRVTNTSNLFKDCSGLAAIDVSRWTTSSMRTISHMFEGCSSVVSLDLSGWSTSRVDMVSGCYSVFSGCSSLECWRVGKSYKIARAGGMVPEATSDNGQWWSYTDQRWYTREEIEAARSGVADMYTSYAIVTSPGIDVSVDEAYTLPDQTYTGYPIMPPFDVNYEGTPLVEGTDYSLSFADNVNAGTATVTITALGDYSWEPRIVTFSIFPKDISGVYVDYTTWFPYTGQPVYPINWVNDGYKEEGTTITFGRYLEEGVDYELSYTDNVNAGWRQVFIVGMGNYCNAKTVPFEILQAEIAEAVPEPAPEGSDEPLILHWRDQELAEGRDYTIELETYGIYPAAIHIVGMGNFRGVLRITDRDLVDEIAYRIDPDIFNLSNALVTVQYGPYPFTGSPWKPSFTVSWNGITLTQGTDYEVDSWVDNVMPGTATVIVRGIGKYSGTAVGTFIIDEPFSDRYSFDAHYEDVLWLFVEGITRGWGSYPNAVFRGLQPVTRCDMAAFLCRLVNGKDYRYEPTAEDIAYFSDVDWSTSHCREIWWLAHEGISRGWTRGDGSHTFRPYANVARCDMACFLMRMAKGSRAEEEYVPSDADLAYFSDVNTKTPHCNAILWLYHEGISVGWTEKDGSHTFRPYANVARADMAAFLHRMDDKGLVPEPM